MKEYIERESLQDEIRSLSMSITGLQCGKGFLYEYMKQYRESVLRIVDEQPTADVQEVRHGRWISNELGGYKWAYYCSECGWVDGYPFNDRHKYCPHCGAKMDGKEDHNG